MISNASDALNQARFELLTRHDALDPDAELCIRISANPDERILIIEDSGVGMTRAELVENLGTIAHSGAKAFMDLALNNSKQEGQKSSAVSDIIGQFGVGFYSVFMVAEQVKVTTRSYLPEESAYCWIASGDDTYTILAADKKERGTTIEIKLKEDAAEFSQENRLRNDYPKTFRLRILPDLLVRYGRSDEYRNGHLGCRIRLKWMKLATMITINNIHLIAKTP